MTESTIHRSKKITTKFLQGKLKKLTTLITPCANNKLKALMYSLNSNLRLAYRQKTADRLAYLLRSH